MDNVASSSRSQPKEPTTAISIPKGPSSTSDKAAQYTWVEKYADSLLQDITNWKRAKDEVLSASIKRHVPLAKEGTDKDLRYYLGLIYEEYGSRLFMRYEGCDRLARHWVTGWGKDVKNRSVRSTMMWVLMEERLPGQAPAMDRLDAEIKADAAKEKAEEKDKGKDEEEYEEESEEENEEIQRGYVEEYREDKREDEENEEEYKGKNEENDQDKAN